MLTCGLALENVTLSQTGQLYVFLWYTQTRDSGSDRVFSCIMDSEMGCQFIPDRYFFTEMLTAHSR